MKQLVIQSGQGAYEVQFVEELARTARLLQDIPRPVFLVDRVLEDLYPELLMAMEAVGPVTTVRAVEEEKTLRGVRRLATWMQRHECDRQTTLVAVGGGIIQDIAAFTSHIYYRGIPWLFVPTTLLSMSDSCIGAKCCINLNGVKNQLGAFHSPAQVILCPEFTSSLSESELASGYGEILKLMLTGSTEHWEVLTKRVDQDGLRNPGLFDLIYQSLEVKKVVIEQDEYEKDLRRILNFGHTFGHALEALTGYEIPHGLAVGWGIDLVNFISVRRGWLSEHDAHAVHRFIERHLCFPFSTSIKASQLMRFAKRDKKVVHGLLHLIVMERPGSLRIVKMPLDASLEADIEAFVEFQGVLSV